MRVIHPVIWVVFSTLLLGGCVSFVAKPVVPEETAVRFEQRSLVDPGLHDFLRKSLPDDKMPSWPVRTWDVDSLALAALYFRPDMELVRTRWAAARAALVTAGQRPNPVFGITPQYNTSSSGISPWIVPLALDVPIETAGKRSARVRRAEHLARSAWWEISTMAWRVRSEVQQGLLALQAAWESEQVIQEQLHVQLDLVTRMQVQLVAGEISAFELAQSRTVLQTLQLTLLNTEREYREAGTRLAGAIGLPVITIKAIEIQLMPFNRPLPEIKFSQARRRALAARADILGALSKYEATQEKLRLEIARQYPNVSLGPGYEFDQEDNKWGLGVSLVLPVMNHNEGPIAEAEARRAEAAAEFNLLQAQVISEIDGAIAAYQAQEKTVAAAERLVSISSQQEQRIHVRKEVGELSRLDELNARAILLNAQQDLLQTRVRLHQSYYSLENALQSPGIMPDAVTGTPAGRAEPGTEELLATG